MHPSAGWPLVSVIIPNYNGAAYLETCLRSLSRQTFRRFETIVVDNASTDDSAAVTSRVLPDATVLRNPANLGFAAAVNVGVRAAAGEWVAILNNDTEVTAEWLAETVAARERHPDAAFFASRILDFRQRDRVYSAGDCFLRAGIGYRRGQELTDDVEYRTECEVFAACGCGAVYRKSTLLSSGGFDEDFFAYLEDVDLGLRLRAAGHKGYFVPAAAVYHVGGGTSGGEFSPLAVRLRTRNALLLVLKDLPGPMLLRCSPMIVTAQVFWAARVLRRGCLLSYLRGLAGVFPLIPAALEGRRRLRPIWRSSHGRLWSAILLSEELARRDFTARRRPGTSAFLRLYFRIFRKPRPIAGHRMISIVIVNWNSGAYLGKCVASLREHAPEAQVIVVDNASSDGSLEAALDRAPATVVVRHSENRGFAAACNAGWTMAFRGPCPLPQPGHREHARIRPGTRPHPRGEPVRQCGRRPPGRRQRGNAGRLQRPPLPHPVRCRRRSASPVPGVAPQSLEPEIPHAGLGSFDPRGRGPAGRGVSDGAPRRPRTTGRFRRDVPSRPGSRTSTFAGACATSAGKSCSNRTRISLHAGGASLARLEPGEFVEIFHRNQVRYFYKHHGPGAARRVRRLAVAGIRLRALFDLFRPRTAAAGTGAPPGVSARPGETTR